jgi:hypothetical protein
VCDAGGSRTAASTRYASANTFEYFLKETNPTNGLVPDNTRRDAPSSIAAVGLALACYPVGAERGFITRTEAIRRTLTTLRFFRDSRQSDERTATGYKGFYYHFLDTRTGQRTWNSEVSTIDTTYLLAGALLAAIYFDRDTNNEREIRTTAATLYHRADWRWAQNGALTVAHGWKPERGFLRYRWEGYNEALLLYVLGLGSPTHPLPNESYGAWTASYRWKKLYGIEFLVRRAALHPPALARLDRLSRHSGRLHARPGTRLLREQSSRDVHSAAVCNP